MNIANILKLSILINWYNIKRIINYYGNGMKIQKHMVGNSFKIAWRILLKKNSFSAIDIGGLATAMASAGLIILWITHEMSYDRFYEKKDRLYDILGNDLVNNRILTGTATPEIMAPILKMKLRKSKK